MKTTSYKSGIPAVLKTALSTGIETQLMKIGLRVFQLLIILCGAFATTAAFGQVTYTWNGAANATNIATDGNWTPGGGPPSGAAQDTGQWDGAVAGNLTITYDSVGGLP